MRPIQLNSRRVEYLDETRPFGVVVGSPPQSTRLVVLSKVPVTLPPVASITVDSAFTRDLDVGLLVDIDQSRRPGHLDTGDARGHQRIGVQLLDADELHPAGNRERLAGLHEDGADHIGSGLEGYDRVFAGALVERLLDGCGIDGNAIAFGAEVIRQQSL